MLQWTWGCIYLFKMLISFPLDVYPEIGLLDHGSSFLKFLRNLHTACRSDGTNLCSHWQCTNVAFVPHPHQYLLSFVVALIIEHPNRWRFWFSLPWWLVMLSTFSYIVGHLYVFFREMSTQVFWAFLNQVICIFLLLSCMNSLYILDINLSSDVLLVNIFSHCINFPSLYWLFPLLGEAFCLRQSHLFIFAFFAFGFIPKNHCQDHVKELSSYVFF